MKKARIIAFYLPQFHPIPENDKWWGKGFTEWTNVGKAKPLFKGHYQPRVPADLGYYDLRLPEVREAQADLAREAGIEGFCYWHYWFGNGKQLLERPFNEVLASGKPDFPFCLGWANHSWSNSTWQRGRDVAKSVIVEQTYPGKEDVVKHFEYALKAFKDKRYITVDGKPLFLIFDPRAIPNVKDFMETWRKLAVQNGLPGIHFVGYTSNIKSHGILNSKGGFLDVNDVESCYNELLIDKGFDAIMSYGTQRAEILAKNKYLYYLNRTLARKLGFSWVDRYDYEKIMENYYVDEDSWENVYPSILPQWDRSPRSGANGIYVNSTPEKFKKSIFKALELIQNKEKEHKILFLKSWNEWAEGNYVEPDLRYGHGYLNAIRDCIMDE